MDVLTDEQAVPAAGETPIDWAHLAQATLGDAKLADDVLGLFAAQAREAVPKLQGSEGNLALLHALKGTARAIGAWRIADAAQAAERCLADHADPTVALAALQAEIAAALLAIAARTRGG